MKTPIIALILILICGSGYAQNTGTCSSMPLHSFITHPGEQGGTNSIDAISPLETSVYYNGAKKCIVVEHEKAVTFQLISSSGQIVMQGVTLPGEHTIDTSRFKTGTYFVAFEGTPYSQSILIF